MSLFANSLRSISIGHDTKFDTIADEKLSGTKLAVTMATVKSMTNREGSSYLTCS